MWPTASGTLVEINCETDFVAKGEVFAQLAQRVLDQAVKIQATDVQSLLDSEIEPGKTVTELLVEANATIGEKIEIRNVARLEAPFVASYLHRTSPDLPPQIGVLVATDGPSEVAKDVAMHAAAMAPGYLTRDAVPAEIVESERRIAEEKSREEGKPEQALAADRRGPRRRVLQGQRAPGAEVREGPEQDGLAGAEGGRGQRHRLRAVQGRRLTQGS